jgi:2'-5' RNA ligase
MTDSLVAIDIAIEPDTTMAKRSLADNAKLLKNFPQGYTLDETHHAHVTMLQRFVHEADLGKVYAAIAEAVAREHPLTWKLKAYKYYYIPAGPIGLAGIVVEVTDDLLRFQQKLIDAVAPFSVATGTADAFFKLSSEPPLHEVPTLVQYIGAFVPEHSGKNFMPHVTIGVGLKSYLDEMLAAPFEQFTFSPAGASVYQLGDFGTARKNLNTLVFHD